MSENNKDNPVSKERPKPNSKDPEKEQLKEQPGPSPKKHHHHEKEILKEQPETGPKEHHHHEKEILKEQPGPSPKEHHQHEKEILKEQPEPSSKDQHLHHHERDKSKEQPGPDHRKEHHLSESPKEIPKHHHRLDMEKERRREKRSNSSRDRVYRHGYRMRKMRSYQMTDFVNDFQGVRHGLNDMGLLPPPVLGEGGPRNLHPHKHYSGHDPSRPKVDLNKMHQKKTLSQGLLNTSLLTATAKQMGTVLSGSGSGQSTTKYISTTALCVSILLEIWIGIKLIASSKFNIRDRKQANEAKKINNKALMLVIVLTAINIIMALVLF